jgi:hypothetical protein
MGAGNMAIKTQSSFVRSDELSTPTCTVRFGEGWADADPDILHEWCSSYQGVFKPEDEDEL